MLPPFSTNRNRCLKAFAATVKDFVCLVRKKCAGREIKLDQCIRV